MAMMVTISCDEPGCEAYEETSVSMEDGANSIEAVLDDGWDHEGGENFCPEHAGQDG